MMAAAGLVKSLTRDQAGLRVQEIAGEAGCSYHTVRKWLKKHALSFAPSERTHTAWNEGKSGYRTNLKHTSEHLDAIRRARSGPASKFWRGGVTDERASIAAWTTTQAPKVHLQYDYVCQDVRGPWGPTAGPPHRTGLD